MRGYPVHVPIDPYRGRDPRRMRKRDEYNRVAKRIEDYLNADLAKLPDHTIKVYLSYWIALDIREDPKLVKDIVFGIDAGSNGVTICKGDFELAMKRKQAGNGQ